MNLSMGYWFFLLRHLICATSIFLASTANAQMPSTTKPSPVTSVNVINHSPLKMIVITDTLLDESEAYALLENRFSFLDSFFVKQGLKQGRRILFTRCELCAFFTEAAMETDIIPSKLPAGLVFREIKAGRFIVAHFEGAYDQIGYAFDAVKNFASANKWITTDRPFEVFNEQPFNTSFPKIVKADIFQRLR